MIELHGFNAADAQAPRKLVQHSCQCHRFENANAMGGATESNLFAREQICIPPVDLPSLRSGNHRIDQNHITSFVPFIHQREHLTVLFPRLYAQCN